jgi:hypothetical protein
MYWNGKCSYEIDIPQFERSRALISARALQTAALALALLSAKNWRARALSARERERW